ncbi:hypothetical protein SAMN06298216_0283 [Spirosomataceae bacterium TFI 002]|nr:hypothetical protein SAMN06298216_0283 [Spirosomataceae bacterium TFI 002]
MTINQEHVKLIFGIKLRELRNTKGLSLSDLSKKTKISHSYLNEIEKGKKYPKSDKILLIANALEVEYDELVSLKLSNKLQPLAILLQSNFLTEIPFDFFGVEPANLLAIMSDAPDKLSAFINAIINIGRNYNMSVENFHHAAMRSYQEMHNNYFESIEEEAANFRKKHDSEISLANLSEVLNKDFDIKVKVFKSEEYPVLVNMRSIYKPNTRELLIHENTTEIQKTYTVAKEIGFQFMELSPRALSSQAIDSHSFDEVLNSFKASYFAGAILIPREEFKADIENWLAQPTWNADHIESLLEKYNCTPETFFYRLTSILAKFFGIDTLFYMRFESMVGSNEYWLTKEMHLARRLGPQEKVNEHYCRRWVSIDILDKLAFKQSINTYKKPLIDCQISTMKENGSTYFVMSIARPLNIQKNKNESVNIGFELTDEIKSKVGFIQDNKINKMEVNQTCERCSIFDCQQRQTAPVVLQAKRQKLEIKKLLNKLS